MKTLEKTKEGIINEGLSEESFEGVEVNSENEFTEFDENNNEEAALDDYHEVSNENETILGEDTDSEEPSLGGNSELNENIIENTEDDTLEKIEGYDYSVVDSEENTPQSIEGEGLNAYYGSYGDADLAELMRTESGQKMVQEVVIGKDDRKKINGTTKYPWRAICSLKIKAKDGTSWIGTGFLIGPRTVITAGHVVYMHKHGGWAKSIEVIPGRNGASKPFGSCKTSHFHSVKGWTKSKKRSNDYGAIILPKNCKFGNKVGYFGYANYNFFSLLGLKVNLSGYPGDKPAGTQWWHCRRIKLVTPRTLVYNIDSAGGQSGSPVWKYKNGKRYVVGIHTNGSSLGNSATRITSAVYKNLKNWKNKYK
ncbi:trypsin-like serine protease [uncultured Tenacibaculum sp.]|uniref:trypsin-like serine peptidase n=1 Tax=uncultured Tenacibaculum sp. TaxID=174713 RepID=UPI002608421D|nr:trypsin-like serine protease [uncultured Tenacibaculum sp.]